MLAANAVPAAISIKVPAAHVAVARVFICRSVTLKNRRPARILVGSLSQMFCRNRQYGLDPDQLHISVYDIDLRKRSVSCDRLTRAIFDIDGRGTEHGAQ
jgi:hypothetical protein